VYNIFLPLNNGSFVVLTNLRVIRKSYEEWLGQFVASLTADHNFFGCSEGVPGCFEGVPGYYGMFRGVPGCSRVFLGRPVGVPGVFQVLQKPEISCIFTPNF